MIINKSKLYAAIVEQKSEDDGMGGGGFGGGFGDKPMPGQSDDEQ